MAAAGTVERVFELARSGTCKNIPELCRRLRAEDHLGAENYLSSPSLRKQLTALIRGSITAPTPIT